MYPSRFRYEAPRSLDEAISTLRDGGDYAKVLAGGQSLVPMMKLRFASPELVVDINNVPGLDYHRAEPDGTLRIGALCRHAVLERSDLLERAARRTASAAPPLIADPIVRNRGTLVGSLCHADPQGDRAVSRAGARRLAVVAQGSRGTRTIPLANFVTGPFQNVLDEDEIVVEAVIPAAQGARSGGYLKLERRVGDFATVGVAVALETMGGNVVRAGIALTGVGGSTTQLGRGVAVAPDGRTFAFISRTTRCSPSRSTAGRRDSSLGRTRRTHRRGLPTGGGSRSSRAIGSTSTRSTSEISRTARSGWRRRAAASRTASVTSDRSTPARRGRRRGSSSYPIRTAGATSMRCL